ncbi:hypothetical protein ACJX0J_021749, partial [Zea mays]
MHQKQYFLRAIYIYMYIARDRLFWPKACLFDIPNAIILIDTLLPLIIIDMYGLLAPNMYIHTC